MIKSYLKKSKLILLFRIIHEMLKEAQILYKHIANGERYKSKSKLLSDLVIRTHSIEKGMSIGNVKVGFGKAKALTLLSELEKFISIKGDKSYVIEICSTINKYILFNEGLGANMDEIKSKLQNICKQNNIELQNIGGIKLINNKDTIASSFQPFNFFSQSRYSIRDFSSTPLNYDLIRQALKLAEKTPSACNRQSWRIHIYTSEKRRTQIFSLQGGSKGFYTQMQCAILICGDINYYNINELNQLYVDGGLYAMNLMYALQFYNVANIPLTMGLKMKDLIQIKKEMHIPENEMPVILIGAGTFKETYKVAISHRRPYETYTSFEDLN